MAWDVAKSLEVLLAQINAIAPRRSKASDGSIGDLAHQAGVSEHNPEDKPGAELDEVDARDFTHDPAAGADMGKISEALRLSRDRRIAYVIFNRRIFYSTGPRAWQWQPYYGDNPHDHHMHVSVNDLDDDNPAPWRITGATEGGFLMALSDQEQRNLYDILTGVYNAEGKKVSLHTAVHSALTDLAELKKRPASTPPPAAVVDPVALATALAGNDAFVRNVAASMVEQLPAELGRRLING